MSGENRPYERVRDVLRASNSRRIAVIDGPNTKGPYASQLEFWTAAKGVIILQRWTAEEGVDVYYSTHESRMEPLLAELKERLP